MFEYSNPKAGMADHLNDIRISSGLISCADIKASDEECCKRCIDNGTLESLLGAINVKTKYGDIDYVYCCKHISLIVGKEKEIIEKFLDFKKREWGLTDGIN